MLLKKETETVQETEFRLVGLSRSGNHAIINWIIRQLRGSYCFLNCTEPKHNPYRTARPLNANGSTYRTNISGFDKEKEMLGNFSKKDCLLYNHEDCFLGPFNSPHQKIDREQWTGPSGTKKDILILRDPFNLFASRIKAGLIRGHHTEHGAKPISLLTLKRLYKQHAREYLGKKKYLKNTVRVNFNSWTKDEVYRRNLAAELDISFSDTGFQEVSETAGGSSFDGTRLSGSAGKMDLGSRWKKYADQDEFWSLFDEEILELASTIFGNIPPVQYALKNDKIAGVKKPQHVY